MSLANPLLDFDRLLLVRRSEGNLGLPQNWQSNCVLPTRGFDDEIDILSPINTNGTLITDEVCEKMIKADIINRVAEEAKITKVKAVEAVEAVFEAMKGAMKRGERIELRGFGVFQVKDRKRGIGRNPKTGVEVAISPGKTVRFKPGKELKNL